METAVYREFAPAPALASLVECFWTVRSPAPLSVPRLNRVLPDGCMDLIFDLGEPASSAAGDGPRSYVVGTMRRAKPVALTGRIDLVGVRFRPGSAAGWIRPPAGELADRTIPLAELWRRAAPELECRLYEGGTNERIALLGAELARRAPSPAPDQRIVAAAVGMIERSGGRIPVAELERALGVSRRRLERLFAARVGVSPKIVCRVVRFRGALRAMERHPRPSWSRLALDCGYYDQAHLIRDFRALSGLTPAALHAERRGVASVQYGEGEEG